MAGWASVRIDDLERIDVAGVHWRPLRRTLGVEAFGINAYTAEAAGEPVVEEHTEESLGHEEVYVVLAGRATFTLDGETLDAPAGTLVHLRDPGVRRSAVAAEPGTTVLAVGAKPGAAYTPSPWESFFYADRHRPAGDFDAMADELQEALERFPDHPAVLYNLAGAEARAGRLDDAAAHLARALEQKPQWREPALEDADLAAIRDRI